MVDIENIAPRSMAEELGTFNQTLASSAVKKKRDPSKKSKRAILASIDNLTLESLQVSPESLADRPYIILGLTK